jgi:hypothetical protein
VTLPFLYGAAVKHPSNCTHVAARLDAGGNAILVRQLLALGATGSREALTTAVMFSHTEVAQLLQMHCRMQHYMGVLAARYFPPPILRNHRPNPLTIHQLLPQSKPHRSYAAIHKQDNGTGIVAYTIRCHQQPQHECPAATPHARAASATSPVFGSAFHFLVSSILAFDWPLTRGCSTRKLAPTSHSGAAARTEADESSESPCRGKMQRVRLLEFPLMSDVLEELRETAYPISLSRHRHLLRKLIHMHAKLGDGAEAKGAGGSSKGTGCVLM